MIHQSQAPAVFGAIESLLDELAPAPAYRLLFDKALGIVRHAAEASQIFLPIDLPMAVADLIGSSGEHRILAATASTLLWSGADLMDDAADGELAEAWDGVRASQLALVSTNLLSTLPHLLLAEETEDVAAAYSQAVSRTLFAMSEGQSVDLESAVRTVEEYLALVHRKSGTEFALFASTPAILAGAEPEAVAGWVRFGFAYGTMIQVFSDTFSTVAEAPHSDLLLGKRSLPVLLTLAVTSDQRHSSFAADLDLAAQGDHVAAARAVAEMTRAGALRTSIERGELLRFRMSEAFPLPLAEVAGDHPIRVLMRAYSII